MPMLPPTLGRIARGGTGKWRWKRSRQGMVWTVAGVVARPYSGWPTVRKQARPRAFRLEPGFGASLKKKVVVALARPQLRRAAGSPQRNQPTKATPAPRGMLAVLMGAGACGWAAKSSRLSLLDHDSVIVRVVSNHCTVRVNDKLRSRQPRNLNLVRVIANENIANLCDSLANRSQMNLRTKVCGRAAISDERRRHIVAIGRGNLCFRRV